MRRKSFYHITIAVCLLIGTGFSCTSDPTGARDETTDSATPDEDKEPMLDDNWREFAMEAASDGMMEVEMADLAIDKAENDDVVGLAKMIKEDHEAANDKLEDIADELEMELPDDLMSSHKQKLEEMEQVSEEMFDQQYLATVIHAHKMAVKKFEDMAKLYSSEPMTGDQGGQYAMTGKGIQKLHAWVDNTLPVLRKHLNEAQKIQKRYSENGQE